MRAFSENAPCIKCGGKDIRAKFCTGPTFYSAICKQEDGEHIHRSCDRCHYQWLELPLDRTAELEEKKLLETMPRFLTSEQKEQRRRLQCRNANRRWLDKLKTIDIEGMTPEQRKVFDAYMEENSESLQEQIQAIEDSERITAEDLKIIVR